MFRVKAGRLKDQDYIGADQLPLKRRLMREFTNTAKEIALDKAPVHIKRQMAEIEAVKKREQLEKEAEQQAALEPEKPEEPLPKVKPVQPKKSLSEQIADRDKARKDLAEK